MNLRLLSTLLPEHRAFYIPKSLSPLPGLIASDRNSDHGLRPWLTL
jgi:hypothetical protein